MLGSRSGFITLVKQKQPDLKETHCMIHREALASKTVPKNLHDALPFIINIVNYIRNYRDKRATSLCTRTPSILSWLNYNFGGQQMKKGNTAFFERLSDILGGKDIKDPLKEEIITHLDHMGDEFKWYFPGINTEDISLRLTKNPFICQVDDVPEDMQNEFLELKHDSSAKDEFRAQDLEEFWPKARSRLEVECDIRCALTKTNPDIDTLVHKKKHHPSH
ncbi:uncharacterized protein LOC123501871 [Portunus trituberculatus]|uniref:uncharacterized protein LOC123501871 n=1 Tax=Portunus trituberculatus TaxID=210409 RepID=UPI001E1CD9F3|nr:uncharacterized protein LOC123501871 [Portunus trituberculatus]